MFQIYIRSNELFMFVSIIIPTYNDWPRLSLCLNALESQTYSVQKFEIIVVNNKPQDKIPDNYFIPANCIIIPEAKSGSYSARNTALKIAKGEIFGFTDSDCIPDKNWIKNAIASFNQNKKLSRLAGNIELFYESKYLTSAELYEKIYAFKQERNVETMASSVTGNMFSYKHVFDAVGNFKEHLFSGGDHEWSKRAQASGFEIGYCETVIVRHPARYKITQLVKKTKRIAGGRVLSQKKNKIKALLGLIKMFKPPLKGFADSMNRFGNDLSFNQKARIFYKVLPEYSR